MILIHINEGKLIRHPTTRIVENQTLRRPLNVSIPALHSVEVQLSILGHLCLGLFQAPV